MEIGKKHAGKTFIDVTGNTPGEVVINNDGWGVFYVNGESISVWINKEAASRQAIKQ